MSPRHGPRNGFRSSKPHAVLLGAIALLAVIVPVALGGHLGTHSSSIRVRVDDRGSHAPLGCGRNGEAVSGGFVNPDFSRETSRLFLFGFNPTGRGGGDLGPLPGGPSWRTTVANRGAAASGRGTLTVFAYCDQPPPHLSLERASVRIAPAAKATATVSCPRGSEVVSGGFSDKYAGTNGSLVFGYRSKRVGERSWRASAFNLSDVIASRLIVLVNCDRGGAALRERRREIEIPGEGTGSTRVRCREGRGAISAGFGSRVRLPAAEGAFPYELVRVRRRAWRASAFAEGPAAPFTAYVYCGRAS